MKYPEYEYSNTRNMCMESADVHMIRVQVAQIRRMSAEEYLKNKMGSGADGYNKRAATGISKQEG